MSYLSKMLEIDKAVGHVRTDQWTAKYLNKDEYTKRVEEVGRMIAVSDLSADDRKMFLELVEGYNSNLQNNSSRQDTLKYILVALLSGGAGFGLGWYAKGAYDNQRKEQMKEIAELVRREMEK
jgi:hypothetical protein